MQSVVAHTELALAPVAAAVSARDRVCRSGEGDTAVYTLRGLSLDIATGRLTAVMGSSDSGECRLMHMLAGGQQQRVFLADGETVRDAGALNSHEVVVAMQELRTR